MFLQCMKQIKAYNKCSEGLTWTILGSIKQARKQFVVVQQYYNSAYIKTSTIHQLCTNRKVHNTGRLNTTFRKIDLRTGFFSANTELTY